jgi:hypothetical protein
MIHARGPTIPKWTLLLIYALSVQPLLISVGFPQTVWRPPPLGRTSKSVATVPRELIDRLQVGKFPVILAKTPLAQVQAELGGTVGHVGDASESLSWVCLQGADQRSRWILWLESAEIDEDLVGGFNCVGSLRMLGWIVAVPRCAEQPRASSCQTSWISAARANEYSRR